MPKPRKAPLRLAGFRRVRWSFSDEDEGRTFPGWTDDTDWNGFLNVWVTPATHRRVVASFDPRDPDSAVTIRELESLTEDARGLISYANGYTTVGVVE